MNPFHTRILNRIFTAYPSLQHFPMTITFTYLTPKFPF